VVNLVETIQKIQARITYLEVQVVPSTLQEVHDQREEAAKNAIIKI
jgi:folate-dependent phosphoribosylglycinamide formyltransferase PurN